MSNQENVDEMERSYEIHGRDGDVVRELTRINADIMLMTVILGLDSSDKHIRDWAKEKIKHGFPSAPSMIFGRERSLEQRLHKAEREGNLMYLPCPHCRKAVELSVSTARHWIKKVYPEYDNQINQKNIPDNPEIAKS